MWSVIDGQVMTSAFLANNEKKTRRTKSIQKNCRTPEQRIVITANNTLTMMRSSTLVSFGLLISLSGCAQGFLLPSGPPSSSFRGLKSSTDAADIETAVTKTTSSVGDSPKALSPMFEYLKFDKKPSFDVLAKTKSYIEDYQRRYNDPSEYEHLYDEQYVLRGPVIGPINRKDLTTSQTGLGLRDAFPNLQVDTFGYTIDPENPYRELFHLIYRHVLYSTRSLFFLISAIVVVRRMLLLSTMESRHGK